MWYRAAQLPFWVEHSKTWICFILFNHWWYYLDVAWLFPHHLTPALDFNFHCEVWKRWSSLTMHLWVELWEVITVKFNRVEPTWIINFVRKRKIRVREWARTHTLPISCQLRPRHPETPPARRLSSDTRSLPPDFQNCGLKQTSFPHKIPQSQAFHYSKKKKKID